MAEDRFAARIGPATLLAQVRSAAPWLARLEAPVAARPAERLGGPRGWLSALRAGEALEARERPGPEERVDYAALCLASHHATVATFIPTDVDSKIRGHLWQDEADAEVRARLYDAALAATGWDVRPVSRRWLADADGRTISGHDGEWLGVVVGAVGAALRHREDAAAERLAAWVDGELARQAAAWKRALADPGLDALRLAAVLTHNAGDVDQGLSYWRGLDRHPLAARWARLAHGGGERHGGAFLRAAAVYKRLMAAEGHRNYPLRDARPLRRDPGLLLPIAPFLDDWGATVAGHEALSDGDRAEVLATLAVGTRKVRGQAGYYRAIAGFIEAAGGLDRWSRLVPSAARKALDDAELRKLVAVPRHSFESSLRKRLLQALAEVR